MTLQKKEIVQLIQVVQSACDKLAAFGTDTVIVFSDNSEYSFHGSQRGLRFLELNKDVITQFVHFCLEEKTQSATFVENWKSDSTTQDVIATELLTAVSQLQTVNPGSDLQTVLLSTTNEVDVEAEGTEEDGEESIIGDLNTGNVGIHEIVTYPAKHAAADGTYTWTLQVDQTGSDVKIPTSCVNDEDGLPKVKRILSRVKKEKKKQAGEIQKVAADSLKDKTPHKHECETCHKVFKTEKSLSAHQAVHKSHSCDICNESFRTKGLLQKHSATHELSKDHMCNNCGKTFKRLSLLNGHMKKRNKCKPPEKITCFRCKLTFKSEAQLREHQNQKSCRKKRDMADGLYLLQKTGLKEDTYVEYEDKKTGEEKKVLLSELLEKSVDMTCPVCNLEFDIRYNCRRHILSHVEGKHYPCNQCELKFRSSEGLKRHMRNHELKPYKCESCSRLHKTEEELKEHQKFQCKNVYGSTLTCDICEHQSMSRYALDVHRRAHYGLKVFSCELCGKNLSTKESLGRHKIVFHTEIAPHTCSICNKSFKVKDTLRKHEKVHQEPKYKCGVCGKACTEIGNLKKHIVTHTKEKPFICETCGMAYTRRTLLDNHQRLHTGERPYKCNAPDCGKNFRTYGNLKQHKATHSEYNNHICDVCGKTFKQRGRMCHHRKSHFVQYRWPCNYCEEKFKSLFMYKNHLAKIHPDKRSEVQEKHHIKLYQCDLCSKVYGDKEDLRRHIYIHKGLKPFTCRHCGKAFNDKSNMRQHEKIHTGEKKYSCKQCFKTFIHHRTLQIHIKNVHIAKDGAEKTEEEATRTKAADPEEPLVEKELQVMEGTVYVVADEECKQAVSVLNANMIPVVSEEQVLDSQGGITQQALQQSGITQNAFQQSGMSQPADITQQTLEHDITQQALQEGGITQQALHESGITQQAFQEGGITQQALQQIISTREVAMMVQIPPEMITLTPVQTSMVNNKY